MRTAEERAKKAFTFTRDECCARELTEM